MVGSQLAHAVAGGLDRLLRPARHPMMLLLEDAPLTVEDILSVPEQLDDEPGGATGSDRANAVTDGLDRLLRPARHPLLQLLEDAPLTVEDILAVPPDPQISEER